VGVSANASRIRQIDLDDKDNFMASDNVFSLAEEMGWWDPAGGEPFEFCYAYADRNKMTSRRREWRVLSLVAPSLGLDPNAENYPFSVKAEKKLSVQSTLEIFRNTYQDTPFDMTRSLTAVDKDGKVVKSPVANPFMSDDYLALFNIQKERTICCQRATYLQITQSRAWLPDAIGGVVWLGYDNPALTPHTPFYCSISKMPDSYMVDGRKEFRRDCAWWAFRQVSKLATLRYQPMSEDIEKAWKEIEDEAFAHQAELEKEALELHEKDPEKAKELLTDYCLDTANRAVDRYWKLAEELWTKYNKVF
jgi:dipeptidase